MILGGARILHSPSTVKPCLMVWLETFTPGTPSPCSGHHTALDPPPSLDPPPQNHRVIHQQNLHPQRGWEKAFRRHEPRPHALGAHGLTIAPRSIFSDNNTRLSHLSPCPRTATPKSKGRDPRDLRNPDPLSLPTLTPHPLTPRSIRLVARATVPSPTPARPQWHERLDLLRHLLSL